MFQTTNQNMDGNLHREANLKPNRSARTKSPSFVSKYTNHGAYGIYIYIIITRLMYAMVFENSCHESHFSPAQKKAQVVDVNGIAQVFFVVHVPARGNVVKRWEVMGIPGAT
jgi:hypothetical protein